MPFLEYADIVRGDRNNNSLMDSHEILQRKAAKLVLVCANGMLNWNTLMPSLHETHLPEVH